MPKKGRVDKVAWVRRLGIILPTIISIVSTILVVAFDLVIVTIPVASEFHFGLMTVNALFGGFLYSNYGMLVGMLDNETIQKVKGTEIMAKRNEKVLFGIVYATLSVVCGLYIVLISHRLGNALLCWAINAEIVFMITAMIFYLCSLCEMNRLVKALNKSDKEEKQRIKKLKGKLLSKSKK